MRGLARTLADGQAAVGVRDDERGRTGVGDGRADDLGVIVESPSESAIVGPYSEGRA